MDEPLLIAENLNKSYSRSGGPFRARSAPKPALIDASLRLDRGEIIGVVGESGSGKTTLARCVALLDRPDSGRVVFKGDDLTALSGAALRTRRRYIQTIFQDPYASLNPRMRIGDALEEERQRICIARALAAEPEILIADEPVSALDVSIQAQVVNLLLDLRQQLQLSIIFIGHDLQLVNFIAPRVIIMLGGRIVETIPEGKSLSDAEHAYTRELLDAVPRLENLRPPEGEGRT